MTTMQAKQIIDASKPNQYGSAEMFRWLCDLDEKIYNDYHVHYAELEDTRPCSAWETDELMVPDPYSQLYIDYLGVMIDYYNGEASRYNNSVYQYQASLQQYINHINRTYMPKSRQQVNVFL